MKLGVPEIDFEHESLINVINALGELMQNAAPLSSIQNQLGEIHAQIEAHFALEEKIMRKIGFRGYEAHKEDHDRLLDQIHDIINEAGNIGEQELYDLLGERLTIWFSAHFRTFDRSFHSASDT